MSDLPFDVLVVDLAGVVGRWLPDRRLLALAQLSGLAPPAVDQLVVESGFADAGTRGAFPGGAFADDLTRLLGLAPGPDTADGLRAAWALAYEPEPRALALIGRATIPTVLFADDDPLLDEALDRELATIAAPFSHRVCSWHLSATRPDPAAFDAGTTRLGVDPARVFYVDDDPAAVDAARAVGWTAHRHTHALDLTAALGAAGLLGPSTPLTTTEATVATTPEPGGGR